MTEEWINKTLKEQYQFVKVLKDTTKSQIIVYRHKELGKKIIKRKIFGSAEVYNILKLLSHNNISNIYDVIECDDSIIILEEYIDGETLFEYLKDDLYTPMGVKSIISSLCEALIFLHSKNIIHKDIKPENIMIDNNGVVKLIDFDASRLFKPYKSNDTNILGTTGYAAPEQYGSTQTDYRTDIYSIGVLINVMLTGQPPEKQLYKGKLRKVILKCIQIVPDNRYQTVEELKKSLKLC